MDLHVLLWRVPGAQRNAAENNRVVDPLRRPIPGKWTGNRTAPPNAQLRISPGSVASRIASQRRFGNTVDANAAPVESMPSRRASPRISTAGLHSDVTRSTDHRATARAGATTRDPNERGGLAPVAANLAVLREHPVLGLPMEVSPPASLAPAQAAATAIEVFDEARTAS